MQLSTDRVPYLVMKQRWWFEKWFTTFSLLVLLQIPYYVQSFVVLRGTQQQQQSSAGDRLYPRIATTTTNDIVISTPRYPISFLQQQQQQQQKPYNKSPTCLYMSRRKHIWVRSKQKFHSLRHSIRQKLAWWIRGKENNTQALLEIETITAVGIDITGITNRKYNNEEVLVVVESAAEQDERIDDYSTTTSELHRVSLSDSSSVQEKMIIVDETEHIDSIDTRNSVISATATLIRDDDPSKTMATATTNEHSSNTSDPTHSDVASEADNNTYNNDNNKFLLELNDPRKRIVPSRPVRDRSNFNKVEIEFDDMIGELYFSRHDIESIPNARVRAILEGIIASDHEPAVYRAFQVLFQDLYPLRLAGRIIFKTLKELTEASMEQQQRDIKLVVEKTGLGPEQVQYMRRMFVAVASKLNGDLYITRQQLTTDVSFLTEVATNVMLLDNVDALFGYVFKTNDKNEKINFTELMFALQSCVEDTCGLDQCNPHEVLHELLIQLQERMPSPKTWKLDTEAKKFNDRYDEMVRTFVEWRHLVPQTGTGRRLDVVRGCFVGAENEKVVEALRTVYVDYSAFRFAGDIIFNLVSSVLRMRGAKM